MNIDLTGKVAMVTGSTSGIGFAIAKGLAACGADVVINGRTQAAVEAAIGRIRKEQSKAKFHGCAADLGSAAGCDALVAAHSNVDILVNNVGIFGPQDFFDTPDDVWSRYFDVNVLSGVRLSRAWLPGMMKRGWGRVLFMSSESSRNIPADMIHYGVTKTAMLAVSRGLAKRVAGSGVTVNAVLPGPTLSDGVAAMLEGDRKASGRSIDEVATAFVKQHRGSSIIGRAASTDEVANMVVYLASPQASATTGAALRVDGGVVDDIL
jgi:NAD(P)-dependent dehydrogenase (short-subunit alcohol dehydrogenase family)